MAENKNNNSEDMSVDELVNLLRNNISSGDNTPEDTTEMKTIIKKADPDKDIASMLKNFIGDEDQSADFELEDAIEETDDSFELESDFSSSEAEFEFDESLDESFGADFDEPADNTAEVFDDFEPDDVSIIEEVAFEESEIPEKEKKKKGLGGLFGFGQKNKGGLADGYAKMLEMELEAEENMADFIEYLNQ